MRKSMLLLMLFAAAALCASGTSQAAVYNTAHDMTGKVGTQGICSPCHIPHGGAAANRLWPVPPTTGLAPGVVASLCASCHHSTGAYGGTLTKANSNQYVFGTNSHGVRMLLTSPLPTGTAPAASGLPYTGGTTNMECTSCHNVHDDSSRPFLRTGINALCARCHTTRNYQGGTDSSGSGATYGTWGATINATNPGSHPVGSDIIATLQPRAPITYPAQFTMLLRAASGTANSGTWSLGGHLDNGATGGVNCTTCHAVHGINKDTTDLTTGITDNVPSVNMLVVAQSSGGNEGVTGRTIASGDASAGNGLCEACHQGSPPTGYIGGRKVNPGASTATHPVDDLAANYEAVQAFPANWPKSSTVQVNPGAGGNNSAICESCHTPHPAANVGRATILASAKPYILRASRELICEQCHTGRIGQHHPVGANISTAIGTGAPANYLATGLSLGTTLSCSTCHIVGGAHNWASGVAQLGINPNWRPSNNGRDATPANYRYSSTAASYPNTTSATCVDCHLAIGGASGLNGNYSPTLHSTGRGINATDNAEYQILGSPTGGQTASGSHFIGSVSSTFFGARTIRSSGQTINTATDNWTTTIFGTGNANGGISRFGGTSAAPILVCESCHNLVPSKNVGNHMLLAGFYEGQSTAGSTIKYDGLCEACHGVPSGTHPMYNDNVGRTGTTLDTTINTTTRPWIAAAAPKATPAGGAAGTSTWFTGGPGTGIMTCDSCHQVHDAPGTSGTLILEGPAANVTGGTPVMTAINANYFNNNPVTARLRQQPPAGGTTGVGTIPDVSRFCDQCHTYRQ